jgi:branched-chain amino acid aminotransferase
MAASVTCYQLLGSAVVEMPTEASSLDALSVTLPRGAYTTFRTYHGTRVLQLRRHLDRLTESAYLEGHPLRLDQDQVRMALATAVSQSGLVEARVRLTLTYDPPGVLYIALEPFVEPPPSAYLNGVRCVTGPVGLKRDTPRAKSTRFIAPAAQARQAQTNVNEVLLLGAGGVILEGSSSNFYAVLDGHLRTADEGVLAGITRGLLLSLAQGLIPIQLVPVTVRDLLRVQEAFLTSVSRAVLPVAEIDDERIGQAVPGPITRELARRYADHLDRELEPIVPPLR